MVRCSERQGEWHGSDSELAHEPGEWRDSERRGRPKPSPWPPLRMPRLAVAHAVPVLSYPGLHDGCREATDDTEQGVQWIQSRTRERTRKKKRALRSIQKYCMQTSPRAGPKTLKDVEHGVSQRVLEL